MIKKSRFQGPSLSITFICDCFVELSEEIEQWISDI